MMDNPIQTLFDQFLRATYRTPPGEQQRKDLQRAFFGGAKVVIDATLPPTLPHDAAVFAMAVLLEINAIKAKLAKDIHSWP